MSYRHGVRLEDVLSDYTALRAGGELPSRMHARIGMSAEAFERAMLRARKAGDPRAATWTGKGEDRQKREAAKARWARRAA